MKDESDWLSFVLFILHPSSFILLRRRSQVVRQRSAKPLFIGSIPIAASKSSIHSTVYWHHRYPAISFESLLGHFRKIAQKTWVHRFARNDGNANENRSNWTTKTS